MAVGKDYKDLLAQVNKLRGLDQALRGAMSTLLAEQKERIFTQGKASNNSRIGKYSEGYLKKRRKAGKGRTAYVVLRFTNQMQFDYQVIKLGKGEYGLGFQNAHNYDKSVWAEERYKKEIFAETNKESKLVEGIILAYINKV